MVEGIGKTSFPGERRRHRRFELSLPLVYQGGQAQDILRTVDVSLGGVKIQTESPVAVDERLDLIILLENEAINPMGRVVRSDPSSNRKYDVGICFETMSHQCRERFTRFLRGIAIKGERAEREDVPEGSGLKGSVSKPFETDRLRANFLAWLRKSYPGDYQRFVDQPKIGGNEIRDFLKGKGIDQANIYYLLHSLGVR